VIENLRYILVSYQYFIVMQRMLIHINLAIISIRHQSCTGTFQYGATNNTHVSATPEERKNPDLILTLEVIFTECWGV
jgi:hypothetical protein